VDDRRTATWVTFVAGEPRQLSVRRCRLTVVGGRSRGAMTEVDATVIRVGGRHGCDLVVEDSQVSGYHFQIELDEVGYLLRDLDSTNGTFVNGLRVREAYVEPGALIHIGKSQIQFEPLESSRSVELSERCEFGDMVGQSPAMRAVFARLERIAPTSSSVLVTGETGVGKELVAEAIHRASPRAGGPLVVIDCSAIPANLIASELFGHEKGAFTGATATYPGAFERATGGTVFLDELGELPVELQPALLGVLERRMVRRVGGKESIPVDIRVIAATNRDLVREINKGRFREDLYYRLAVMQVAVPPLRERREDIPLLVERILSRLPGAEGVKLKQKTLDNLMRYDFPGNVRELRNLIERAVIMSDPAGETATLAGLAGSVASPGGLATAEGDELRMAVDVSRPFKAVKSAVVGALERAYFHKLLEQHGGNVSACARAAGLDRMTVHKLLQRHGITGR